MYLKRLENEFNSNYTFLKTMRQKLQRTPSE